jgi:TonB family protein
VEYFFDFNKKGKEKNTFIIFIYSLILHGMVFLGVSLIRQGTPKYVTISVSTNTIQLAAKSTNSSKQTIQKHQDKKMPTEELIKSSKQKQSIHKEIPSDNAPPLAQPKSIVTPTPTGQSSNSNKEFFSAESTVDKTAQCTLPEINLTEDASNAGITSGSVIIEVQINSLGKVVEAKLIKGTGYKVDEIALRAAKELNCKPAWREKENVGVIKRINWIIIP